MIVKIILHLVNNKLLFVTFCYTRVTIITMINYKKDVQANSLKDILHRLAVNTDSKAELVAANIQFLTSKGLTEVQLGDCYTIKELLISAINRNNVKIKKEQNIKIKSERIKKR